MSRPLVAAYAFVAGTCAGFGIAAYLTIQFLALSEPAPVQSQASVVRSLQLRIDNVDKLSHSRGDRYRLFNCREVAR